jgi:pantoate--beta-alanine ligase
MILFKKITDLCKWLEIQRKENKSTGFVPTMGALHPGHISLVETSLKKNAVTVSSIFVNPTQFNDQKDFERYPITIEKDIDLLEDAGCDVLFLPAVNEMYPDGLIAKTHYNLGHLENILEGKYRPGHFQGVCRVVQRLLEIVQPDNLYLGQKDYQQCKVITKLVELMGQKGKISIIISPTLREANGLAMSSRNMRLNDTERKKAATIYQCLSKIKETLEKGSLEKIKKQAITDLEQAGFKTDYVEIADAYDLTLLNDWDGKQKLVALIAAYINDVRLIDNMVLN